MLKIFFQVTLIFFHLYVGLSNIGVGLNIKFTNRYKQMRKEALSYSWRPQNIDSRNNGVRKSSTDANIGGESFMRKGYLSVHSHKVSSPKSLTYYKGRNSKCLVEKPGIRHLHQVIEGNITHIETNQHHMPPDLRLWKAYNLFCCVFKCKRCITWIESWGNIRWI